MDCSTRQASLSFSVSRSLFILMPIELVMPSNHLILCRSLLLSPSVFPSIRVFSNKSVLHNQVSKVLERQLQYLFFQWIFSLLDWLVWSPCTLKSLLQHHNLCYWVGKKKFVWVFPLDITEKPKQNFGQFSSCVPGISHLSLTHPSQEERTSIPTFQMRNLRLKECN